MTFSYRCLLNIAMHMEGHNVQNLFSTDPSAYQWVASGPKNRKVVRAGDNTHASFFMVGMVTESRLTSQVSGKEICVKPMARLWPRSHATLSAMLDFNGVALQHSTMVFDFQLCQNLSPVRDGYHMPKVF